MLSATRLLTLLGLIIALAALTTCVGGGPSSGTPRSDGAAPATAAGNSGPAFGHSAPVLKPAAGGLPSLPAPRELLKLLPPGRRASFTPAQGHKDGADYNGALGSDNVSPAGSAAGFAPAFHPASDSGLSGLAYCIYDYILPSPSTGALLSCNWGTAPADANWFIGLANFDANRWDWFAGPYDGPMTVATLGTYMTASDDFFLVMAVMGTTAASLTEVQILGVEPPHAQLTADVGSGLAPLAVTFDASGSFDTDGSIVDYEWDFNGNGTFNEAGAETAAHGDSTPATYTYSSAGDFEATVRVTDDDGARAAASLLISVNTAPTVLLAADVTSGEPPLNVTFTATVNDANGTISAIEWDFDGDGTFGEVGAEASAADDATPPVYTYSSPGSFDAAVRVTDNDAAQAQDSVTIAVGAPPQVELSADVTSGPKPLVVTFTATAADPGGSITDYEWDFDGDGTYNEAGEELGARGDATPVPYAYTSPGTFTARVRVTDNDGGTATDTLDITVTNTHPTAVLNADVMEGDAPLTVTFDGSSSVDADGSIVDYEWDFNGNGIFNESGNGEDTARGNPTPPAYTYTNPGPRTPRLRVTDDDGATDTGMLNITAHGWKVLTIDDPVGLDAGYNISMQLIDGRPAIAQATLTERTLRFTRCATADGASTADWTSVMLDNVNSPLRCKLGSLAGYPAISYFRDSGTGGLLYTRSTTPAGDSAADWCAPVEVDVAGSTRGLDSSIRNINGFPAIAYFDQGNGDLRFAYSSSVDGASASDWSSLIVEEGSTGASGGQPCLTTIGGYPAISYCATNGFLYQIRYVRSSTASGTNVADWAGKTTVYTSASSAQYPSLMMVNGDPAVAFQDGDYYLHFTRSTDSVGTAGTWTQDVVVDNAANTGEYASLRFSDGVPLIAYHYQTGNDLKFVAATSATGAAAGDWANKETVLATGTVGRFSSLIILASGNPAIAFRNEDTAAVMYAIRY